jgi:hypothetical protein
MHRRILAAVTVCVLLAPGSARADAIAPWTVFRAATRDLPMSENRLVNPGFEAGPPDGADGWRAVASGAQVDAMAGRSGGRALKLANSPATDYHGALQVVTLDQTTPKPIYLAGWSRAEVVTGTVDANYSLYLDLRYTDDTPLYGQRLDFATGTHDWQFLERFIVPVKPVRSISVYCLLRFTHGGTAWFDDLEIREVDSPIVTFDGTAVAVADPPVGLDDNGWLGLVSGGGPVPVGLAVSARGGATAIRVGQLDLAANGREHQGGFIVRDAAAGGDFAHAGGTVKPNYADDTGVQDATWTDQGLSLHAVYSVGMHEPATADRVTVHAEVVDTTGRDRAVTLYYALPIDAEALGWNWYDDALAARAISGTDEFSNVGFWGGMGVGGRLSKYPWAVLGGPREALAIAVPVDQPRAMRLVYNAATRQLYAAFDLGLSASTGKFPGRAWVDFSLYAVDPAWGFRSAAQGYYDRFPDFFRRRVPPEREGIWVAFSDLDGIPDIGDFGIGFHELGDLRQVAFDDAAGILSFRYIAEPWSHWLAIEDAAVDPDDYDQVANYLERLEQSGSERAQATISSGFRDEIGRYRYRSTVAPWCNGRNGCAVFTVNPDPDITDPFYPMNKAFLEWTEDAHETYRLMALDGEYIDSFLGEAMTFDFHRPHFAAADTPLSFRTADARPGVPEVFATTEFARWLTDDVHDQIGKVTMANGMLLDLPWGADLFDFMGTETDWLRNGQFAPESDARLWYRRALSYQRPYGMLMNTDFEAFGHGMVERYFQMALFYGLYPSLFSHNASENQYWANPAWYERDRDLFMWYIPLVRRISAAGWQPITRARTSDAAVLVERYGGWPDLYFTLRNTTTDRSIAVDLALESVVLGLPAVPIVATGLVGGGSYALVSAPNHNRAVRGIEIAAGATELLHLTGELRYVPAAFR